MTSLKPCPFCGKTPQIIYLDDEGIEQSHGPSDITDYIGIHCPHCDVTMVGDYILEEDADFAIKRWNKRVNRLSDNPSCRKCKFKRKIYKSEEKEMVVCDAYNYTFDIRTCEGCEEFKEMKE